MLDVRIAISVHRLHMDVKKLANIEATQFKQKEVHWDHLTYLTLQQRLEG